ncbi:GLPGLI family protein [Antarcticibacterium flavum]|uniref:GLPGLI family protein n=1 Tax=Antarcticibacterium flavum TaxID=2058175 RepID=A0A5B7X8Q4_9FLAO|nr:MULTISPECIES: GLPGLI family protein [Antarcticibacterium]MCM4160895.1 GLPGLI family protein [Antarcticibacterium sp. W02-3]QCY71118.1 GLPGLI family protein [Antarcticibacterium flavum]
MQTAFSVIFFFIVSTLCSQTQIAEPLIYRASYELTYKPDSTNPEDVKKEEFLLYRGNNLSLFASKGRILRDSLAANIKLNGMGTIDISERAAMTKTNFNYVIYKGFPEDRISYTYKIIRDHLRYEEELDLFSWEILPETKELQGFSAQKATTTYAGRDYVAWFTSEIPIPDGPYKFNGLPGLILEVADTQQHYVFTLTGFEKYKDPLSVELKASDFIKTDKKKLLALKKEYALNPFAALERSNTAEKTVTINFKEGQKEKLLKEAKEKVARENNPIELN